MDLMLLGVDLAVVVTTQGFVYYQDDIGWSASKSSCECLGTLAIIDTQAKHQQFVRIV